MRAGVLSMGLVVAMAGCQRAPDQVDHPPQDRSAARQSAEPMPVCINEFMPANQSAAYDSDGHPGDWVELFNPSNRDVALRGWTISDDRDDLDPVTLSADLVVPAAGFLVLWADGEPDAGAGHLDFQLVADGEEVVLTAPTGERSIVTWGRVHDDFSAARRSDCCMEAGCWEHRFRGTPGFTNAVE